MPYSLTSVQPRALAIEPLRDDALEPERAGMLMKCGTLADLVVAVTDRAVSAFEEGGEIRFAVSQRQRHQIAPVAVQQIKDEIARGVAIPR